MRKSCVKFWHSCHLGTKELREILNSCHLGTKELRDFLDSCIFGAKELRDVGLHLIRVVPTLQGSALPPV